VEFDSDLLLNNSSYKLFGIIDHLGNELDKGHYVSNVLIEDSWWVFNDDEIKKTEFEKVNMEKAYMLFYQRVENNNDSNEIEEE